MSDSFTATCPRCDWAVTLPTFEMAGTALREHTGIEHPRTRSFVSEKYVEPEPPPVVNDHPHIQDLVVEDIRARKVQGIAKYGTALQGFNGRDALTDAYQEALDRKSVV